MTGQTSPATNPVCTVVWDIDGVLADNGCSNRQYAHFFHKKGLIIDALATHYIFPGVAELFQRLVQEPNIHLAFFSSGADDRGTALCPKLLERIFGEEKGRELSADLKIGSRSHLTKHQGGISSYGLRNGHKQKDLRQIVTEAELANTVLVEDDSSYTASQQAPNLLKVQSSGSRNFQYLIGKAHQWDSDNFFSVPAFVHLSPRDNLEDSPSPASRRAIARGRYISADPLPLGGYQVAFKKQGQKECMVACLRADQYPDLCNSLASLESSYDMAEIQSGEVLDQLHAWIAKSGGEVKIRKVLHSANRIYYIAGVLLTALERARSEQRPLTAVLSEIQYEPNGDGTYEPRFVESQKEDRWYHIGLAKLQEINPSLSFTTPTSYTNTVTAPLTKEESEAVEWSVKHENSGCVIM